MLLTQVFACLHLWLAGASLPTRCPRWQKSKHTHKLSGDDARHLNSLVRTVLFTELMYGGAPDVLVERALKVWQKDVLRVEAGVTSPLEASDTRL